MPERGRVKRTAAAKAGRAQTVKTAPTAKKAKTAAEVDSGAATRVHDDKRRCAWSQHFTGAGEANYVRYHDTEWGVPLVSDASLFEHLVLEGAQAGLSWSTILSRRAHYTRCFKNWDVAAVAAMTEADVEEMLKPESGIVRHRGKIESAINNAKCMESVPAVSEHAKQMCSSLKERGLRFVGAKMCYALMQGTGMVNDHTVECFRHKEVQEISAQLEWPFPPSAV